MPRMAKSIRPRKKRALRKPRKAYVPRKRLGPNNKIVNVARRQYSGTWTFSTGTFAGFCPSFTWAFNVFPNYNEFQNVFRYYRICAVRVDFIPRWTNAEITTAGGIPTLYIRQGRDSTLATLGGGVYSAGTLNAYMEAPCKRIVLNRPRSYYIKVNTHNDEAIRWKAWFSTQNNVAEPYFGFNAFMVQPGFGTTPLQVDIAYKYYVQFKGIK